MLILKSRINAWAAWRVAQAVRWTLARFLVGKPIRIYDGNDVIFTGKVMSVLIRFPVPDRPHMVVRAMRPGGRIGSTVGLGSDFMEAPVSSLLRDADGIWSTRL